jgi:hypothetical protein
MKLFARILWVAIAPLLFFLGRATAEPPKVPSWEVNLGKETRELRNLILRREHLAIEIRFSPDERYLAIMAGVHAGENKPLGHLPDRPPIPGF